MEEPTRKIKPLSIVFFALAAVFTATAVFFIFFGGVPKKEETQAEPIDVYYATEQDEPVYLTMQYMSESVAYLEAVESMQYYVTFDSEWNPAVICLYDSEKETYQPYIDWLYSDEEEGAPEEIQVTGYSVPFDEELKQYVIENINILFGEKIVTEENFTNFFGGFYLTVGQSSGGFNTFNAGIYCLLGMVVCIIIGVAISYKSLMEAAVAGKDNYLEVHKTYKGRGVLGALLGALLGGVLWAVVGALGFISGWIGILIVLFATTGYKLFAKEESGFGTAVSIIFSLLVIFPATYLAGVWTFYQELNKVVSEYIPLGRAFLGYSEYLTNTDSWGNMIYNMVMGYVFMLVAGCYSAAGVSKRKKEEKSEVAKMANVDVTAAVSEEDNNYDS